MRRAARTLLILATGCARIQTPPGGPPDRAPPLLLSTFPDSLGTYPGFQDAAEFQFDEVVSEGGSPNFGLGTGDLEKLVLVSPTARVPVVRWKRDRITVRPREGWKPNTVYRVELLPGIADLRNNRDRTGRIITFSTGAPLPRSILRGMVVDWNTLRPMRLGLVEAVHLPDSLSYRTLTDSAGKFRLEPIPDGEYLVYGVADQNNNLRREVREEFDSVRVAPGRDSVGEIWVFRHDTAGVRISTATNNDSLAFVLNFSQFLNPYQQLPPESVEVRMLPDSIPVPVLAILPKPQYDSAYPPFQTDSAKARADSLRRSQDSVRSDSVARARAAAAIRISGAERRRQTEIDTVGRGPLKTKPPLFDKLYVRVGTRLKPSTNYAIVVHGIQNVSRVTTTARSVARIPEPPPPADSLKKVRPTRDTAAAKPDSTRRPP